MNKPQSKPHRLQFNTDDKNKDRIENYRFNNRIGSQSTAIEQLIGMALDQLERQDTKKSKDSKG